MRPSRLALALAPLALSAAARADVIVVDNSFGIGADHFTIPTAVAAASDGDVLLVRGSVSDTDYAGFTVTNKALTIVADTVLDLFGEPKSPKIVGTVRFENLAPGKLIAFHGFDVEAELLPFLTPVPLEIEDCSGAVVVEDSSFHGSNTGTPTMVRVHDSADVTFLGCSIDGVDGLGAKKPGEGIHAERSTLRLFETHVTGGDGADSILQGIAVVPGATGSNAIALGGGSLYASGSSFVGGNGGTGTLDIFGACWSSFPGGHGVHLTPNAGQPSVVRLDSPGTGGSGGGFVDVGCGAAPDGAPLQVDGGTVTELKESARGFSADTPVRVGEAATLSFQGAPGDAVFLFYSTSIFPVLILEWSGPLYPSPFAVETIGTIPGGGTLDLPVTFNSVAGESISVWLQPIHLTPGFTAAVTSSPALLLLLDASL